VTDTDRLAALLHLFTCGDRQGHDYDYDDNNEKRPLCVSAALLLDNHGVTLAATPAPLDGRSRPCAKHEADGWRGPVAGCGPCALAATPAPLRRSDPACQHRWSPVMACDFCDAHDPIATPAPLGFDKDSGTYQFGPAGAALMQAISVHDDYFGLVVVALDEARATTAPLDVERLARALRAWRRVYVDAANPDAWYAESAAAIAAAYDKETP
jgi:hypothetical protein